MPETRPSSTCAGATVLLRVSHASHMTSDSSGWGSSRFTARSSRAAQRGMPQHRIDIALRFPELLRRRHGEPCCATGSTIQANPATREWQDRCVACRHRHSDHGAMGLPEHAATCPCEGKRGDQAAAEDGGPEPGRRRCLRRTLQHQHLADESGQWREPGGGDRADEEHQAQEYRLCRRRAAAEAVAACSALVGNGMADQEQRGHRQRGMHQVIQHAAQCRQAQRGGRNQCARGNQYQKGDQREQARAASTPRRRRRS